MVQCLPVPEAVFGVLKRPNRFGADGDAVWGLPLPDLLCTVVFVQMRVGGMWKPLDGLTWMEPAQYFGCDQFKKAAGRRTEEMQACIQDTQGMGRVLVLQYPWRHPRTRRMFSAGWTLAKCLDVLASAGPMPRSPPCCCAAMQVPTAAATVTAAAAATHLQLSPAAAAEAAAPAPTSGRLAVGVGCKRSSADSICTAAAESNSDGSGDSGSGDSGSGDSGSGDSSGPESSTGSRLGGGKRHKAAAATEGCLDAGTQTVGDARPPSSCWPAMPGVIPQHKVQVAGRLGHGSYARTSWGTLEGFGSVVIKVPLLDLNPLHRKGAVKWDDVCWHASNFASEVRMHQFLAMPPDPGHPEAALEAGRYPHPNLVRMLGWTFDTDKCSTIPMDALVYEAWDGDCNTVVRALRREPGGNAHVLAAMGVDSGGYLRSLVDFLCGAASGVLHLHQRGVVHGDLSPSNVMYRVCKGVDGAPSALQAGIGDLGSAHLDKQTRPYGFNAPTPFYLPPQRGMELTYTTAFDVFSFGALMLMLLVVPHDLMLSLEHMGLTPVGTRSIDASVRERAMQKMCEERLKHKGLLTTDSQDDMVRLRELVQLILRCLIKAWKQRPLMLEVFDKLQRLQQSQF